MKSKYKSSSVYIVMLIFLILPLQMFQQDTSLNSQIDDSVGSFDNTKMKTAGLVEDNQVYFDNSDFTNVSHEIKISRSIRTNSYGYTSATTEIFINNTGSKAFNAFNYSIPTSEYDNIRYLSVSLFNETEKTVDIISTDYQDEFVTLTIQTTDIEVNSSLTLNIITDHLNSVTFDPEATLVETEFPYIFNMSFMPFVTLPITSYNLFWDIGFGVEFNLDNSSILPNDDLPEDVEYSTNPISLILSNVSSLNTISLSSIENISYGILNNYDLNKTSDRKFIPAYSPSLKENYSIQFYFEFFQKDYVLMEFTSLVSHVTINEWKSIHFSYEIILKNVGIKSGTALSTDIGGVNFPLLKFFVPKNTYNVRAKDNYGNVSISPAPYLDPLTGKNIVEIPPRIGIADSDIYKLNFEYTGSIKDYLSDLGNGKVRLTMPLSFDFNWTIQDFKFSVYFPHGSTYSTDKIVSGIQNDTTNYIIGNFIDKQTQSVHSQELLNIFNKPGFKIGFSELTPLNNRVVDIDFGLDPFYFIKVPLTFIIFLFALGLIYTLLRNLSFGFKSTQRVYDEIPVQSIRNFVKIYEEKTALRERIFRLEMKRQSKKISQRDYEQTLTILKNKQSENDKQLVSMTKKFSEKGQRYALVMRTIQVAETEREDILKNIETLESRKSTGRISKEVYNKIKLEYEKKLRKANNDIDKVLIELRALLSK